MIRIIHWIIVSFSKIPAIIVINISITVIIHTISGYFIVIFPYIGT